ncbi:phospholipase [Microbulbifer flavimaris]|uniref:Phospholipase A1 n=2 Tax=Microbulbiferaceae TaxID=1706373 RepID=A0ABX4HZA3_9GAMM|nr:phospholipase [Microbulbifer sp. ZGT114]PCO05480.1 phospholipase [Microbulbifer flavimaris]
MFFAPLAFARIAVAQEVPAAMEGEPAEPDLPIVSSPEELPIEQREDNCLREQLLVAPASITLEEMRRFCAERVREAPHEREPQPLFGTVAEPLPGKTETTTELATSQAAQAIRDAANNPFTLASHKVNYLLPVVYNPAPNEAGLEDFEEEGADIHLNEIEVQFQLSVQVPVWRGFLGKASFMSLAYTNRSFWQAYNSDASSPFRETNHEPELIVTWLNDWSVFGFQNVANQLALNHQSNGRSEPLSRSWNRVYANFFFERENMLISFKPWYRIPEDSEEDDNPDIEAYLGYFELSGTYNARNNHSVSLKLRNNLRSNNRGAFELRWGFPMGNRVRGYVKYFTGYGESLIDYDEYVNTLGIGFELARGAH